MRQATKNEYAAMKEGLQQFCIYARYIEVKRMHDSSDQLKTQMKSLKQKAKWLPVGRDRAVKAIEDTEAKLRSTMVSVQRSISSQDTSSSQETGCLSETLQNLRDQSARAVGTPSSVTDVIEDMNVFNEHNLRLAYKAKFTAEDLHEAFLML